MTPLRACRAPRYALRAGALRQRAFSAAGKKA
jgi:hypothetical protein